MQFLNSLITGFFLFAMSKPVGYYGYFLTREYIHPNYVEKMERGRSEGMDDGPSNAQLHKRLKTMLSYICFNFPINNISTNFF